MHHSSIVGKGVYLLSYDVLLLTPELYRVPLEMADKDRISSLSGSRKAHQADG
jgi:hypothetical protein